MCGNLFKGPSMPAVAHVAPAPEPLKNVEENIMKAQDTTRRRAAALASLSGANMTSPLGLVNQAATTSKSLLGQ